MPASSTAQDPGDTSGAPPIRQQLLLSVPAIVIGVVSALVLWALDRASEWLQDQVWGTLPAAMGISPDSGWWIFSVLTITGAAVGFAVWAIPGHGGPDSATTELGGPPAPLAAVPSMLLVVLIGLVGGVSLGPENPIIAVNSALAVALLARGSKRIPEMFVVMLASSATIGALFGTPVAAALLLTGVVGAIRGRGSLWDKLYLPVAAAAAGALTMHVLGEPSLAFSLPPMGAPTLPDLGWGVLIAAASAVLGLLAAVLLPVLHRAFHALRNPFLFTALGGAVLGLLGVIGGPMTLFKGLNQTGELLTNPDDYGAGALALMTGIKLLALVVATGSGFRGGRVFPIVFAGTAFGLFAHAVVPDVPLSLAVACGVMGMVLVAVRDGWMALFLGIALTGDLGLLPLLCVIVLPTWLIVSRAPALEVREDQVRTKDLVLGKPRGKR